MGSLQVEEAKVLARAKEESFLGVYFQDERIGFVRNRFTDTEKGDIHLRQEAYFVLNILDRKHPVKLEGEALLTSGYLLKGFSFRLDSIFYRTTIEGEVDGKNLHLEINTGKDTISRSLQMNSPPFISTNRRAYLLAESLEQGDKIRIPYFDPFTLSLQNTTVTYQGREKVVVNGRVRNLHRFRESFAGIRVNSWLDDKGDVVKEESSAGFTFIAEPEFQAKDIKKADTELLSSVSAPLIGKMPDLEDSTLIRYRLHLPEEVGFNLQGGRQFFTVPSAGYGKADDESSIQPDTVVLTIKKESIPGKDASACKDKKKYLQATPYIQSDHSKIREQAVKIISAEQQAPVDQVKTLTGWVYHYLDKKPVIGIPDAVTTLAAGKGDCNEHAVLFAALARSMGIPARIASGVTFQNGAFYYHAWNEVCLDQRWLSLDSTKNQVPADLSHIKFIQGGLEEQVKIGSLLGRLKIEVLD
ncbi:MAG: transglutaminase domain-containing protein [Thermodesulfobacteriota bacterium]